MNNCQCSPDSAGNHAVNCPLYPKVTYVGPVAQTPMPTGWICPRCQVVHAPWVVACACMSYFYPTTPIGPGITYGPSVSQPSVGPQLNVRPQTLACANN
jgi:hypothetical protein